MRTSTRTGLLLLVIVSLLAASCSSDSDSDASDTGPAITVASFNFNESVVLAEIYAQALEAEGYDVERRLNLGSRELLYPEFSSDGIDLLPEYLGSALAVGFGEQPSADPVEAAASLSSALKSMGARLLEPAPGEDKNVYVVTEAFADEHGLRAISDLAELDTVVLSGPAECETRTTCLVGLLELYELDNLEFRVEQETAIRVASLRAGNVAMTVLFSTLPVFAEGDLVALDDDRGIASAENIVPVVSDRVVDAYGEDFVALVNRVSAAITTDVLIRLNARVEIDAQNPDDVAAEFLEEAGLTKTGSS